MSIAPCLVGPITTLTIQDTVFYGQPAVGIFSLYLCGTVGMSDAEIAAARPPWPNPATSTLQLPTLYRSAEVRLLDLQGRVVLHALRSATDASPLNVGALPRGA